MSCPKRPLCAFNKRTTPRPVTDSQYQSALRTFCDGGHANCAISVVFDKIGFLKCPKDLMPNELARAKQILA